MKDTILLVTNYGIGHADEKLRLTLVEKYLELLLQSNNVPSAICFYTEGVKLVCDGSPVLSQLKTLESKNVRLIVCSTCLNYFELTGKMQVGIVGGMGDIMEAQFRAATVITL
jgi:hypothetical protein